MATDIIFSLLLQLMSACVRHTPVVETNHTFLQGSGVTFLWKKTRLPAAVLGHCSKTMCGSFIDSDVFGVFISATKIIPARSDCEKNDGWRFTVFIARSDDNILAFCLILLFVFLQSGNYSMC